MELGRVGWLAHATGSTAVAVAARDHGLDADNTVFVGSPGVGVDRLRAGPAVTACFTVGFPQLGTEHGERCVGLPQCRYLQSRVAVRCVLATRAVSSRSRRDLPIPPTPVMLRTRGPLPMRSSSCRKSSTASSRLTKGRAAPEARNRGCSGKGTSQPSRVCRGELLTLCVGSSILSSMPLAQPPSGSTGGGAACRLRVIAASA
jgi:hypothetical protein